MPPNGDRNRYQVLLEPIIEKAVEDLGMHGTEGVAESRQVLVGIAWLAEEIRGLREDLHPKANGRRRDMVVKVALPGVTGAGLMAVAMQILEAAKAWGR